MKNLKKLVAVLLAVMPVAAILKQTSQPVAAIANRVATRFWKPA